MADVVVCGVLLKQVVAMVDATEVLVTAGCVQAAFLPARAAFEASVYADYILQSDSERRATRYVVGNYRGERLWAQRVIPGTTEEATYRALPASLGLDFQTLHPTLAADAAKHLLEVDRILSQPELHPIDAEFTRAKGRRKRDPEWYTLDGLSSIRQVAESVGRLAEYECFYSKGSQVTHVGSYKDHILFSAGQIRLKPIRHLDDFNALLNGIVTSCLATYKSLLNRYRPDELEAFGKRYYTEWREPFLNAPRLKYNFAPQGGQ
ncbi:DUF5677 domain-containing protein [Variovorax sp. OV700]|uniref:DUF5677 domain-containing protein n=1 Tax=Variovorax sp. OV700 TaxID=1882826 RepID=UPI0011137267|nr:DUF5677 domain-containing protein [Variovorax sp. OV700]